VDGAWDIASKGTDLEAARAGIAALHEACDLGELDDDALAALVSDIDRWQ
jgi:hypothetical protein